MEDKRKIEGWIIDEADISKKDWKEIMKKWVIAESKLSKKTGYIEKKVKTGLYMMMLDKRNNRYECCVLEYPEREDVKAITKTQMKEKLEDYFFNAKPKIERYRIEVSKDLDFRCPICGAKEQPTTRKEEHKVHHQVLWMVFTTTQIKDVWKCPHCHNEFTSGEYDSARRSSRRLINEKYNMYQDE